MVSESPIISPPARARPRPRARPSRSGVRARPGVADGGGGEDRCARRNDGDARLNRAKRGHEDRQHAHGGQATRRNAVPAAQQPRAARLDPRGRKKPGLAEVSVHEGGRNCQDAGGLNREIAPFCAPPYTNVWSVSIAAVVVIQSCMEMSGERLRPTDWAECGLAHARPRGLHRAQSRHLVEEPRRLARQLLLAFRRCWRIPCRGLRRWREVALKTSSRTSKKLPATVWKH